MSVAGIIGRIYDATLEQDEWSVVLCDIADWCGVENAALVALDPRIEYASVVAPRADPRIIAEYNEVWWSRDPTATATAGMTPGQLSSLSDTGRDTYFSSAFHNEFWRTSGLGAERLATNLITEESAFASFVLQTSTSRDYVDTQTSRRFRPLIPHLTRAIEISRRLHAAELERRNALVLPTLDTAGMIVVDRNSRVVFFDQAAEAMLEEGATLLMSRGAIRLADPQIDRRLHTAVAACARAGTEILPGTELMIIRQNTLAPLTVEILPYRTRVGNPFGPEPAAVLLLRDPELQKLSRIERLRVGFNLTRAEANLALELARGDGREAAAGRCGISVNTARTHLMRIFEKTGVRRQAELTRLVIEHAGDA